MASAESSMRARVRVLYFASAREAVEGIPEEWFEVNGRGLMTTTPTLEDLANALRKAHGGALAGLCDICAFAVNEEYAPADLAATKLKTGDVVAIIPPISGG